MAGPCLCGDIRCPSCGPAQGNEKCYACGEWMDDHAEHILGEPDCTHDEARCSAAAQQMAKEEAEHEDLMDKFGDDYQKAMESYERPPRQEEPQ